MLSDLHEPSQGSTNLGKTDLPGIFLAETQHHAAPRGQNMARNRVTGERDAQRHGPDDSSTQSGKHNVLQLGRRRGVVNLETITDMQSWCRTWPSNGSSRIRANTNFSGNTKELAKVLGVEQEA